METAGGSRIEDYLRAEDGPWPRVEILGIDFDKVTLGEALARIQAFIESGRPHQVVTANPEMVYACRRNSELRRVLQGADLVLADGIGIVWASSLLKTRLPERVTGIDLVQGLLSLAAARGYRPFFLGGRPGVAAAAAERAKRRYEGLEVAGTHHGYFGDEDEVLDRIEAAAPDILFVGMGSPRQETFIARHLGRGLKVPVCIGVGGSLDVLAGAVRRAPEWVRLLNLEWLFRLIQEPARARRMTVLPLFAALVIYRAIIRSVRRR